MQTLIHITYSYSHSICLCIKFGGVRFISVLVATFSFVFEFFYIRVLCHTCISKVFGTQNIPIRNDATDAYERKNDEKRTKNRFQNRNLFNIYVIIWCSLIVVLRIIKCISKVFVLVQQKKQNDEKYTHTHILFTLKKVYWNKQTT